MRQVIRERAKKRTSGPIATGSAGVWLRDRVESVVVLCLEQSVKRYRYRSLPQRDRTAYGVSASEKIIYRLSRSLGAAIYLSPDSTSNTRRLGSSERRAARTQPAVPAGVFYQLGAKMDGKSGELASSDDDDVVLRLVKRLLAGKTARGDIGRNIVEVREEKRFLRGAFRGLEDEKGGDDGKEGEMRFWGGHGGSGCAAYACTLEANNWIVPPSLLGSSSFSLDSDIPTLWNVARQVREAGLAPIQPTP